MEDDLLLQGEADTWLETRIGGVHTDISEEGAYWHDMAEEGEYK